MRERVSRRGVVGRVIATHSPWWVGFGGGFVVGMRGEMRSSVLDLFGQLGLTGPPSGLSLDFSALSFILHGAARVFYIK